ncbi:MAG: DJ-1/PfpI family protein [Dysgonomonas sp.]
MRFNIILFPDFETLDVFGPVEIFGKVNECNIEYYSLHGGLVANKDNVRISTQAFDEIPADENNILFIPGGLGTRSIINDKVFIENIKALAENSIYVITVCTGSALLAKTGLLDGSTATSNKLSFEWVMESSDKVKWVRKARWVVDGKYYTSSGVSAGIDMALGFIHNVKGFDEAKRIAHRIEYHWQQDKDVDLFCNQF